MHSSSSDTYGTLTIGTVVDTNDPQQMGRIRVRVPAYGDTPNSQLENLPWCLYVAPFGGSTTGLPKGPNGDFSEGHVSYGMWNIPKLGAKVLIGCIDGDPATRFWLGCLFDDQLVHTMPHGRFLFQQTDGGGEPEGPLSTTNGQIQPLYDNQLKAFKSFRDNYEWRTRGADRSVSAFTAQTQSSFEFEPFQTDDEDVPFQEKDGNTITSRQGYEVNGLDPDRKPKNTVKNLDPQTYMWATPGFHAISMDDRFNNCRMRFRTSTGHQILLDDTNERIYISTSEGANWLEMDTDGSIDIFGVQKISIHSENDLNLTSNKTIRLYAKDSIHMHADNEIRLHAINDLNFVSDGNIRTRATEEIRLTADGNIQVLSQQQIMMESVVQMNFVGGETMLLTATALHLNGPTATSAAPAGESLAFWTNRVPDHEPWARTSTSDDFSHDPKYEYDDSNVGREHKTRGPHWHR